MEDDSKKKKIEQNRRQHPRVDIQNDLENAKALVGAQVIWPEKQTGLIYDLSYSGAAVERVGGRQWKKGEVVEVLLALGTSDEFAVGAKTVWFNDKIAGLQFQAMNHRARMSIDEFLEDKLIGAHMISVSPQYFSEQVDFNYWFHGPSNTNVFLWEGEPGVIRRAMVSFDGEAMIFENGEFHRAGGEMQWEVQASYSADSLPKEKSDDLLVLLDKENPLVERAIEILTQLSDLKAPIAELIKSIKKVRS